MDNLEHAQEQTALLRQIRDIMAEILALSKQRLSRVAAGGKPIASDAELNGQYGDPEVRAKDPRDWAGQSMKGRKFSECPAEYLDLLADRFDYFEQKATEDGDDKKKKYAALDARRARGWSARIRAGLHTPPPVEDSPGWAVTDDEPEVTY